jgi:hypothetical protein
MVYFWRSGILVELEKKKRRCGFISFRFHSIRFQSHHISSPAFQVLISVALRSHLIPSCRLLFLILEHHTSAWWRAGCVLFKRHATNNTAFRSTAPSTVIKHVRIASIIKARKSGPTRSLPIAQTIEGNANDQMSRKAAKTGGSITSQPIVRGLTTLQTVANRQRTIHQHQ